MECYPLIIFIKKKKFSFSSLKIINHIHSSINMFWLLSIKEPAPTWQNRYFGKGAPFNNLEELCSQHPLYLFGWILIFCCYPGFLYLGTQIGYLLFGKKTRDKGVDQ